MIDDNLTVLLIVGVVIGIAVGFFAGLVVGLIAKRKPRLLQDNETAWAGTVRVTLQDGSERVFRGTYVIKNLAMRQGLVIVNDGRGTFHMWPVCAVKEVQLVWWGYR